MLFFHHVENKATESENGSHSLPAMQSNVHIDFTNDELLCPITLELFHDPVIANDGHVYEREAIVRWILEKGTSPLTREPLNINDLQPDDYLRRLAARKRNSIVSYNAHEERVTLPPLRSTPSNIDHAALTLRRDRNTQSHSSDKICSPRSRTAICTVCFIIFVVIIAVPILIIKNSNSFGNWNAWSTESMYELVFS